LNAAARKLKLDSKSIKAGTTAKAVFGTRFAKKNTKVICCFRLSPSVILILVFLVRNGDCG